MKAQTHKEAFPLVGNDEVRPQEPLFFAQILGLSTPQKLDQLFQLLELDVAVTEVQPVVADTQPTR